MGTVPRLAGNSLQAVYTGSPGAGMARASETRGALARNRIPFGLIGLW
jgi:hypothetical protein